MTDEPHYLKNGKESAEQALRESSDMQREVVDRRNLVAIVNARWR